MPLYNGYYYPVVQRPTNNSVQSNPDILQLLCGEYVEIGNVLFMSGNVVYNADASSLSSSLNIIGISCLTITSGSTLVAFNVGSLVSLYSNLITGKRYFLGLNGKIIDTPIYKNVVEIGIAASETTIIFNPKFIIQR